MKKMGKYAIILWGVLLCCFIFSMNVRAKSAVGIKCETSVSLEEYDQEGDQLEIMLDRMKKSDFYLYSASLSSNKISVSVTIPSGATYVQVELCDRNGKHIAYDEARVYANFQGVKNNTVYLYRARALKRKKNAATGQFESTYGQWSKYRAFVKVKCKSVDSNESGKNKEITFKVPKIKGVKSFTLSMSKKRDKNYVKIKTVKPGAKVTVSTFKNKKLKRSKTYYIKVTPNLKKNVDSDMTGIVIV